MDETHVGEVGDVAVGGGEVDEEGFADHEFAGDDACFVGGVEVVVVDPRVDGCPESGIEGSGRVVAHAEVFVGADVVGLDVEDWADG